MGQSVSAELNYQGLYFFVQAPGRHACVNRVKVGQLTVWHAIRHSADRLVKLCHCHVHELAGVQLVHIGHHGELEAGRNLGDTERFTGALALLNEVRELIQRHKVISFTRCIFAAVCSVESLDDRVQALDRDVVFFPPDALLPQEVSVILGPVLLEILVKTHLQSFQLSCSDFGLVEFVQRKSNNCFEKLAPN